MRRFNAFAGCDDGSVAIASIVAQSCNESMRIYMWRLCLPRRRPSDSTTVGRRCGNRYVHGARMAHPKLSNTGVVPLQTATTDAVAVGSTPCRPLRRSGRVTPCRKIRHRHHSTACAVRVDDREPPDLVLLHQPGAVFDAHVHGPGDHRLGHAAVVLPRPILSPRTGANRRARGRASIVTLASRGARKPRPRWWRRPAPCRSRGCSTAARWSPPSSRTIASAAIAAIRHLDVSVFRRCRSFEPWGCLRRCTVGSFVHVPCAAIVSCPPRRAPRSAQERGRRPSRRTGCWTGCHPRWS